MTYTPYRKNFRSEADRITACHVGLSTFLRRLHPRDTAACVEAETGISAATVEKWLCHASLPQARQLARLIGAYGPSALAALFPQAPRWLDDAVRAERLRQLEDQAEAAAAARDALRREIEGRRL